MKCVDSQCSKVNFEQRNMICGTTAHDELLLQPAVVLILQQPELVEGAAASGQLRIRARRLERNSGSFTQGLRFQEVAWTWYDDIINEIL